MSAALMGIGAIPARADVMYTITVNTSSLSTGDYIDLQFNPANVPQSATANAFNYSGPNLNVTPMYTGDASGNLRHPQAQPSPTAASITITIRKF